MERPAFSNKKYLINNDYDNFEYFCLDHESKVDANTSPVQRSDVLKKLPRKSSIYEIKEKFKKKNLDLMKKKPQSLDDSLFSSDDEIVKTSDDYIKIDKTFQNIDDSAFLGFSFKRSGKPKFSLEELSDLRWSKKVNNLEIYKDNKILYKLA